MSSVVVEHLSKTFGAAAALHPTDLSIASGEFIVIIGPSGCGKSTLLRLIAGLETPSAGRIEIGGRDVTAVEPADRGIAMVFQSYALYPHLSVAQNIAFPL
uniref:ATP-binding cassette domain-containing protein n=1 Tax=Sphingomonas sp. TREG-RG-20F-R18-01 TaxID=2914982 RepID=UPI001F5AF2A7